jgi:hypothetical protein
MFVLLHLRARGFAPVTPPIDGATHLLEDFGMKTESTIEIGLEVFLYDA